MIILTLFDVCSLSGHTHDCQQLHIHEAFSPELHKHKHYDFIQGVPSITPKIAILCSKMTVGYFWISLFMKWIINEIYIALNMVL
jgi:hypothetical protein